MCGKDFSNFSRCLLIEIILYLGRGSLTCRTKTAVIKSRINLGIVIRVRGENFQWNSTSNGLGKVTGGIVSIWRQCCGKCERIGWQNLGLPRPPDKIGKFSPLSSLPLGHLFIILVSMTAGILLVAVALLLVWPTTAEIEVHKRRVYRADGVSLVCVYDFFIPQLRRN